MGGGIRKIKAIPWCAYLYSLVLNAQPCKYDMYKSSLRHTHDPVLSSLKMKGIRFFNGVLKLTLKLTLKQLQHVSVQSPSSGSALFEHVKVTFVKTVS
jgi:hypothetical protein